MHENKKIHVLLIENDATTSALYKEALKKEGFFVSVENNGVDGEKAIQKNKPNIVILDILLEKKDGFSILHDMRENARTAHIPVIILTHLGHKEDVLKGELLGAKAFFVKARSTPADVIKIVKNLT